MSIASGRDGDIYSYETDSAVEQQRIEVQISLPSLYPRHHSRLYQSFKVVLPYYIDHGVQAKLNDLFLFL